MQGRKEQGTRGRRNTGRWNRRIWLVFNSRGNLYDDLPSSAATVNLGGSWSEKGKSGDFISLRETTRKLTSAILRPSMPVLIQPKLISSSMPRLIRPSTGRNRNRRRPLRSIARGRLTLPTGAVSAAFR